ncbi:MAG TPA: molecular chaperone HtpG [Thermoanaerobaculia bacterium]|jgi:molecular chaperone HtpG|nr:molecular chaperone HtpG [Thermoanaerobaculia bacterium]
MATETLDQPAQTMQFQAETKQLLDLMIHSLYSNKEIFLRELISNSSDALDRLRFEALTRPELLEGDEELKIHISADRNARTLTITDNGIGMSRDEVITNIGTIAKSGTRELVEKIKASPSQTDIAQLIGQFGVGFYSSFMAAEKVELVTRRAGETEAVHWESTGDGTYKIEPAGTAPRGTSIKLYLKPEDRENGMDDFSDRWVISRVVRRYSDFVGYPITLTAEKDPEIEDLAKERETGEKPQMPMEDKVLNSMKPLWTRSQSEVKFEEYNDFYRHISHDWTEPLKVIQYRAEGRIEYQALLFIPATAPYDLFYVASKPGLQLYVKRVQIMEKCEDLLPQYLRFVRGVVDSPDLQLNVSREMLQQDRFIALIRKGLTKKILDTLEDMKQTESATYLKFWKEFGRAIKEGVSADYENKERLLDLLLFESSNDKENLTSLREYVDRMKEDQNEIFYLTGDSRSQVESSPHLEAIRDKGYEVLYLTDTVDELLTQSLNEYGGKRLKSLGKGTVSLGNEEEKKQVEEDLKVQEEKLRPLLDLLQKKLDENVKHVRLTNRLTTSPACLVGADHDYSPQLERLLQKGKGGGPKQRRIMELNPKHDITAKLFERFEQNQGDPTIEEYAQLLFGYGLLAEGSELPDAAKFNRAVADLMTRNITVA